MPEAGPSFQELLARARAKDRAALGGLLEPRRARLIERARERLAGAVSRRVDPHDAVQQVFLDVHASFMQYRGATEAEFDAWLDRVCDNNIGELLWAHTRAQKRAISREESLGPPDGSSGDLMGPFTTPSQRAVRGEDVERLVRALATLPPDQREAVRLRYLDERTLGDIAAQMGRSPAAVAGLLKRGVAALRARMAEEGPAG